jgi:purine-binding chemotaxis protein CheW
VKHARSTPPVAAPELYVTMRIDRQLLGIAVMHVRDVMHRQPMTPIPLAPPEIAGAINLRGRIVTVVDMRQRLGLPPQNGDGKSMLAVVEHRGELYGLIVDHVGEVLRVTAIDTVPAHLSDGWKDVAQGIFCMDGELLVLLHIDALLAL